MTLNERVQEEFEQRARGRPRKVRTVVVNIRIAVPDYDKVLVKAIRRRVPARSVIRHIIAERVNAPDFL